MKYQIKKQNLGLTKVWMITMIIILLILISGGIYLLIKTPAPVKESGTDTEESNKFITDCGNAGPETSEEEYEIIANCIEEKFKECQPAKFSITMDLGPLGGETTYYYEIIGPIGNLCEVRSKFLKNINPDWVGKEMFCQYDNTKDLETAMQDMSKCEGPLYDLMTITPVETKNGEKFVALALDKPEEESGHEWQIDYDLDYLQFIGEAEGIKSTTHIMYEFLALKSGKTKIEFSLQSKTGEEIDKQIVEVTIE